MTNAALSLDDWLARLETYSAAEIDLGLERVVDILERLPISLPKTAILVGGTNGKGSSVAMLEAVLSETGHRVACYTSPHIHRYNERIRIAGEEAGDAAIIAAFERIDAVRNGSPLTYFEFGTLAALLLFSDAELDVAVFEVGMGGRLDAVNVIDADACLITNVALDHCEWLGEDIESIAMEKAGIMRAARPTVYASPERPAAINAHAMQTGAHLIAAERDYHWEQRGKVWCFQSESLQLDELPLPSLPGAIQVQNAAGVLALLDAAGFADKLSADSIAAAIGKVELRGRMQRSGPNDAWLFDVAHNPAAAAVLSEALGAAPVTGATTALIGMLADKDVAGVVAALAPSIDHWIAITADSPRGIEARDLAGRIASITGRPCRIADQLAPAIEALVAAHADGDRILVTGSFFAVGPVLRQLELYSPRLGNS